MNEKFAIKYLTKYVDIAYSPFSFLEKFSLTFSMLILAVVLMALLLVSIISHVSLMPFSVFAMIILLAGAGKSCVWKG
jgi:hypothetical protein